MEPKNGNTRTAEDKRERVSGVAKAVKARTTKAEAAEKAVKVVKAEEVVKAVMEEKTVKPAKAKKAAKAVSSYRKLLKFGKIFEVDKDEDYKAAAMTYAEEAALIAQMRTQLAEDGMTVSKEYVKGRQNVCVHPLVTEIPKHVDCANRTLGILGEIIVKRGRKKPDEVDGLSEFRLT